MSKCAHDRWFEEGRYIPWTKQDFDPNVQLAEHPRDAKGNVNPLDPAGYVTPDPYVFYTCRKCGVPKREKIPTAAYERVVKMLKNGEMSQEHLSQLPLGELIPEMAELQGEMSGASRVTYVEEGGDN